MEMHDYLLAAAAVAYLGSVLFLYFSIAGSSTEQRRIAMTLTGGGLVLHALAQYQHWSDGAVTEITILHVLSLCALAIVALLMISLAFRKPLYDAGLVALPLATLTVGLEWLIDVPGSVLDAGSTEIRIHIFSSITAFGVLSVAGVYAIFVAIIDHFLRRHHLNPLVRTLPALDILESLLFQLISAGYLLLTISLVTGLMFINDLFAQHLAHKTILSIIAWLVFGSLLWGRWFRGWRGRVAVRLTLAGIVLLLLSYFGSKLVLELLLERSW